jgi:AbrB family looped-hinge helix DNA binding protein
MKVTTKGQVTIPLAVREDLGIRPSETEIDFICDKKGNWYLKKIKTKGKSRFRTAHKQVKPTMSTDELMALTRG